MDTPSPVEASPTVAFLVRLPHDVAKAVERASREEDRSKRSIVERALRAYLMLPAATTER